MTQNKLTTLHTIKLFQFLDARKDSLQTRTAEHLAGEATQTLGFKVLSTNVASMRQEMGFGPRCAVKKAKQDDLAIIVKELALIQTFSSVNPSEEFKGLMKKLGI